MMFDFSSKRHRARSTLLGQASSHGTAPQPLQRGDAPSKAPAADAAFESSRTPAAPNPWASQPGPVRDLPPPKAYVAVFCGARSPDAHYLRDATRLGRGLAAAGLGLVFGGTLGGSMGAVCEAVLAGGGHVIGVAPGLNAGAPHVDPRHAHRFQMLPTADIETRKLAMVELSDALVALPGGWGTLDEITYFATRGGAHNQPMALLDTHGFYTPLARHAERLQREGFANPAARWILCATPEEVMTAVAGAARSTDIETQDLPAQRAPKETLP